MTTKKNGKALAGGFIDNSVPARSGRDCKLFFPYCDHNLSSKREIE